MQISVVSLNIANPLTVSLPCNYQVEYLPVFIYFSQSRLIRNFIKPADILHSPYTHFRAFLSYRLIIDKELTVHFQHSDMGHGVKCHYVYIVETTTTPATLTSESQSTALTPTTPSESSVSTVTTTPTTETIGACVVLQNLLRITLNMLCQFLTQTILCSCVGRKDEAGIVSYVVVGCRMNF